MSVLLSVTASLLLAYGGTYGAEALLDRLTPLNDSRAEQLESGEAVSASVSQLTEEQMSM